ncbi:PTS sugar transporter subunit IIB [Vagococcus sp. BWB3-3]|uniref:PTS sugar transporter subunit IIB n=1 Tax=Vagococcus allomyrinae TaxID=2794353 RepID=A0A940P4M3_9ENTE|nr:PTS sugar transporter subunit IIB [Vagococcus allomyrinae]MBP1040955.1 PTS sugar transporter subunit IIB [Vagococcus allomyrinae]
MMNVLTVCGMGFGTSLMLLMEVQDMGKRHGFEVNGEATDLSSAKGKVADLIIASSEIAKELAGESAVVVPIVNLLDKEEIQEKVLPHIQAFYA